MNELEQMQKPTWKVYNVAQGILTYERLVLLVGNDYGGPSLVWSLPGGRLEPGEAAASAVVREFREETGLTVVADDLVFTVEAITRRDYRQYLTNVFAVHLSTPPTSEPAVSFGQDEAVRDVRWVAFEDVPALLERPSLGEGLLNYLYYGPARLPRRYWLYSEYWSEDWQPLKWPV